MDTLTYMLRQSIGIYYKDLNWANHLFDKMVKCYPAECVSNIRKSIHEMKIELKDGSTIRFVNANESAKGCRFSKIIIQPDIDQKIIDWVIRPTLRCQNNRIIVLEEDVFIFI